MLFLCALCTVLATAVADIAQNNSYKHIRQVPYASRPAAAAQYLPQSSAAVQRTSAPAPAFAPVYAAASAAAHTQPVAQPHAPVAYAANLQHVQQLIAASAIQYTAPAPVPQQGHSPIHAVQRPAAALQQQTAAAPARASTGAGAAQSAAPAPQRPTLTTPPSPVADFPLYSEYFEPSDQYLPKRQ